MKNVIKTNKSITRVELEELYAMYAENLFEGAEKKEMNPWIDEIIAEPDILYSLFYSESEKLAGYIIIYLREKENYVREFEVNKEFQNDGVTFKYMIRETLPNTNTDNVFTGRILPHNDEAKGAFKRMGALGKEGIYEVTAERIMKSLELEKREDFAKKDPDVEKARKLLDDYFKGSDSDKVPKTS